MDNQKDQQKKTQKDIEQGFPIQLKLLIVGIIIGLTILILEFAGFFK